MSSAVSRCSMHGWLFGFITKRLQLQRRQMPWHPPPYRSPCGCNLRSPLNNDTVAMGGSGAGKCASAGNVHNTNTNCVPHVIRSSDLRVCHCTISSCCV